MVWWRCPTCGGVGHLIPDVSVERWYEVHAPGLKPGEFASLDCPECGVELRVGHRVKIRVVPTGLDGRFKAGDEGVLESIEPEAAAPFVVAFRRPKRVARFRRSELSYIIGQGGGAASP